MDEGKDKKQKKNVHVKIDKPKLESKLKLVKGISNTHHKQKEHKPKEHHNSKASLKKKDKAEEKNDKPFL